MRAATLSGAIFGLAHLANCANGLTADVLAQVAISTAYGLLVSYPASYLYQRGGFSIWGFLVAHVGIDSINFFHDFDWVLGGINLGCVLAGLALIFPLARKWLPAGTR